MGGVFQFFFSFQLVFKVLSGNERPEQIYIPRKLQDYNFSSEPSSTGSQLNILIFFDISVCQGLTRYSSRDLTGLGLRNFTVPLSFDNGNINGEVLDWDH